MNGFKKNIMDLLLGVVFGLVLTMGYLLAIRGATPFYRFVGTIIVILAMIEIGYMIKEG